MLRMMSFLSCLLLLTISFGAPSALAANKVLSLDGDGDYVEVPDDDSLDMTNSVTIEAWVMSTGEHDRAIVSKGFGDSDESYFITRGPQNSIRWHVGTVDGWEWFDANTFISSNKWYHVAVTYNGSTMTTYVNGNYDGSIPHTGALRINEINLTVGSRGGNSHYWGGIIDEVRIWNVARTQEEIRTSMNQPIENPELLENLVGYWNFDNGTAGDLSQYGNDGTLQGDATIVEAERAKVIFVPDDYPTIQEAIDAAKKVGGKPLSEMIIEDRD